MNDLKEVANLISQDTVTAIVYSQKGKFGVNTFLRRFGTWNKALEAAGLKVIFLQNIEDEVFFENLANVWQHLGRQPVGKDLDKAIGCSKRPEGQSSTGFSPWVNE